MKPLPESHFTLEDLNVIIDVVLRCGRIVGGSMFGYWVMERSRQSDRRDAELMLEWQTDRGMLAYADSQIVYVRGGGGVPEFYA
jgi:hypothetical protein